MRRYFTLPFSHLHNIILTHLNKQFLMLLNDDIPACFLSLFNYLVFNLPVKEKIIKSF